MGRLNGLEFFKRGNTPIRGIALPFLALLALSFLSIVIFSILLMQIQNRNAIAHAEHLFEAVMSERFDRMSELVLEYGYWDEAVNNLIVNINPDWIENNFDPYLFETLNVSEAQVLDQNNDVVFSSIEGERASPQAGAPFGNGLDALIAMARITPQDI